MRGNMNIWVVFAFSAYIQSIMTDETIPSFSHVHFVEIGKNTNISCNISRNSVDNFQWYKEKEDGGLEAVPRTSCYTSNQDDRYQVYCNDKSVGTMKITNVSKSDSGVYYCSLSGLDQTFHIASTLIVTEQYPKKPTLSILASVADYQKDSKSTVFLCVAFNWTKEWNSIQWTLNGTKLEGWTTLDSDGSLRSLIVMSESIQYSMITCYIKEARTGDMIFSNFTRESAGSDAKTSSSDCYIVLYVGLPFISSIILIHQLILAIRRRTLSKDTPRPDTHQERRVRFSPEDESVTYAAVRS